MGLARDAWPSTEPQILSGWIEPVRAAALQYAHSLGAFAVCAVFFAGLAWLVKGRAAIADARGAAGETRINLTISLISQLTVGPLLTLFLLAMIGLLKTYGLHLQTLAVWTRVGEVPTLLAAVFIGDFIGYWRHRLQHTAWLWPAHAIHHSDTRLTWISLERMHPVDQLGSAFDTILLSALGFPFWALAGNVFIRHYWGFFIHADVPWTLGKANLVMNSPAMHRWHHARDVEGSGHNFATVFSVFDRLFGTYYQPGPCQAPLGVREDMGRGVVGQYLHPLRIWWRALRRPGSSAPVPPRANDPAPIA
jgi:sterol desaturase/sphingolipid hydroxylase (fatty acid hydroxylase superfamily)